VKGGDISADPSPRIVIVWEGLIAYLPPDRRRKEERLCRRKRWAKALDLWTVDPDMAKVMRHLIWNLSYPVDILCTHPEGFARHLWHELDKQNFPFRILHNEPLVDFARSLATMPEVLRVVYLEGSPFQFGGKGLHVNEPLEILNAFSG
jgi:hypothetical protein